MGGKMEAEWGRVEPAKTGSGRGLPKDDRGDRGRATDAQEASAVVRRLTEAGGFRRENVDSRKSQEGGGRTLHVWGTLCDTLCSRWRGLKFEAAQADVWLYLFEQTSRKPHSNLAALFRLSIASYDTFLSGN